MSTKRTLRAAVPAFLAVGLVASVVGGPASGASIPANKIAASGNGIEEVGTNTILLQEQIKMSNPADLIIGFTAVCGIITEVTSSANNTEDRAFGEVDVWITLDGEPVPVGAADIDPVTPGVQKDDGRITLCNRAQEQQWTDSSAPLVGNDDGGDQLRQRLETETANGFTWMALNVGRDYDTANDNIIDVVVHAAYSEATTATGEVADAFVGNRTLVLEPGFAAHREQVTTIGGGSS